MNAFLPMYPQEVSMRGWSELDIILVSGDAYVDHPSYGTALIGRYLERLGYRVGIIAQPDWRKPDDFMRLGKPRLFFGITAGNVDSMVARYTAHKRSRREDEYSPGAKAGLRPDRAVIVYANCLRKVFNDTPLVLGGLESSLRRLAHYDYWSDSVRRSILLDARADILVYGMGERAVAAIAGRLSKGQAIATLTDIRGTACLIPDIQSIKEYVSLPSYEEVSTDTKAYTRAFTLAYNEMNPVKAKPLVQQHANRFVVVNPPALPLSVHDLDSLYDLPYMRRWHSVYDAQGGVPGFETVRWSITSHRGCSGECSFCALYFHQGRMIQSRSKASIVQEAQVLTRQEGFGGTITDIGGPTANMYKAQCPQWERAGFCSQRKCLVPQRCQHYALGYSECIDVYRSVRALPGVKNVFIGSGIRYDLLTLPQDKAYMEELCAHHISGLMKVAPEHGCNEVLRLMGKPDFSVYEKFIDVFKKIIHTLDKKIFIVNYFITGHPGTSLKEALRLALYLAKRGVCPEQIQDFIPTPMTVSSCMYWTGKDPFSGKLVYIPRTERERKMQRALLQYNKPANRGLITAALDEMGARHVLGTFVRGAESSRKVLDAKDGSRAGRVRKAAHKSPNIRRHTA